MKKQVKGMKLVRFIALAGAISFAGAASADNLQLIQGSSQKVSVPGGVKKISVSNPSVLDASPSGDGKSVTVTSVGGGSGEVRVEQLDGKELVIAVKTIADIKGLTEEIKLLLSDVEGLVVKEIGNKVVLDGKLITKAGYDRVQSVADAYSGVILNLAKLDRQELNEYVAKAVKSDIGIDSVNVRVSGDTATLEGVVYDEADVKRANEVAKLRVASVVNLLQVQEVMIETDIIFLQVNKTSSKDFGFNILKTLGIDASAQLSGSSGEKGTYSYTVGGSISAKINALVGAGNAKVLAQPHISTKSGGTGRFHNGGEIFFKVTGVNAGNLDKVEYGVILTVKPALRGKENILNEVSIEVSVPNSQTTGDLSLDKFDTTSTTLCKNGDSILISGLTQSLQTRFKEKTPLLGDIPILKTFFSESSTKVTDTDLILVLMPHAVKPTANNSAPFSESHKSLLDQKDLPIDQK